MLHIVTNTVILGQIGVDIGFRLTGPDADILRQGKGGDTVHNAEVDGLGPAAQQRRDLIQRRIKDLRGRDAVEILPAEKGLLHGLVVGNMRKQTQLDLAVVGVHKDVAGRGDEHPADLCTELLAHRDILQVRLRRGQAACRRHGHLEIGVDAPVGLDDLQQPLGIGGFELGEHPVIQHLVHDGMLAAQLVQNIRVRAPAGLGLFAGGQHQLVKKHRAELLGRQDVEFMTRVPPDALLKRGDARVEALAKLVQRLAVNEKADLFHVCQNPAQRQFDRFKERGHAIVRQLLFHRLPEPPDRLGAGFFLADIARG